MVFGPASELLLPVANAQLAKATGLYVAKYRELLRTLRVRAEGVDEGGAAFELARRRVVLRLHQRQRHVRLDPVGALQRVSERWRLVKAAHRQRWRTYCAQTLGSRGAEGAPPAAPSLQQHADQQALLAATGPDGLLRALVIATVGGACKLFLQVASRTTVEGGAAMHAALQRPPGQALVTVSNHVASVDDPLVTSALVPPLLLLQAGALRWTLCATDRCFRHAALAPFFRAGKVLPVERGKGVEQLGMQAAAARLGAGDWVHIFPEGTRGSPGRMLPARRGVGWLVASCDRPPLVLPFVHSGMEGVVPRGAVLPRPGREVRVLVGDPVPVEDLLLAARVGGWGERELHCAIADRVGAALYELKARLDGCEVGDVAPERQLAARALEEDALLPLIEEELGAVGGRVGWRARWDRLGMPVLSRRAVEAGRGAMPGQVLEEHLLQTLGMLRGTVHTATAHLKRAASSAGLLQQGSSEGSSVLRGLLAGAAEYSLTRAGHMQSLLASS